MLKLYHIAPSRSSIALWMLEEVGEPYELQVLGMDKGEHKQPAYLAVNPMGKVPALDHDGVVVTEAAAICAYLAESFPKANLAAPVGDRRRGAYLKWLFFGSGCLEPAVIDRMLKREPGNPGALGYGSFEMTLDVLAAALATGPWLLGEQFTAADVVIGANLRWSMSMMKVVPERPEFVAYVKRIEERPAARRAGARDAEIMAARATQKG